MREGKHAQKEGGMMLIVASPTASPLCTSGRLPTDGQPEWWRCFGCGNKEREDRNGGIVTHKAWCLTAWPEIVSIGPFPFTVARWAEVERGRSHPICWTGTYYEHVECLHPRGTECIEDGCENEAGTIWGPYWCPPCDVERLDRVSRSLHDLAGRPSGAVVELVEVTGPSHHADECWWQVLSHTDPTFGPREGHCHPDAAPDCWHTPTGKVTTLDVPVPCERPNWIDAPNLRDKATWTDAPASHWWADASVQTQLRGDGPT